MFEKRREQLHFSSIEVAHSFQNKQLWSLSSPITFDKWLTDSENWQVMWQFVTCGYCLKCQRWLIGVKSVSWPFLTSYRTALILTESSKYYSGFFLPEIHSSPLEQNPVEMSFRLFGYKFWNIVIGNFTFWTEFLTLCGNFKIFACGNMGKQQLCLNLWLFK